MGFSVKFNWVLQINPPAGLQLEGTYPFSKSENRIFPIGVPIDLIDKERVAVAKIKIKTFTNELDGTTGLFEVIKIYAGQEKTILSDYWKENE